MRKKTCMAVSQRDDFVRCGTGRLRQKRSNSRKPCEAGKRKHGKGKILCRRFGYADVHEYIIRGVAMDMNMGMTGTIECTSDPDIFHMDGTMSMDLLNMSVDMDMYTQVDGDKSITYINMMDEWMKSEETVEEGGMEDMYTVAGDGKDMTLAEETEKIGDKEVYVLTSTISGEEFQEIMGSMEEMTESLGEVDFSTMEAEVTLKIYKDTVLPHL